VDAACDLIASTRPTAVNLIWAIQRMRRAAGREYANTAALREALVDEALAISREQEEADRAIGHNGAALLPDHCRVITHCNAGGLATVELGTALGVIRAAHEAGKIVNVFVDETRPLLQGARLTAWELQKSGIPLTLICDNMAGYFMSRGEIDAAVVGADRIAANGDTANKIGTYPLAVLAQRHGVAFYVAAPLSTFDLSLPDGSGIPIEERDPGEVCGCVCGGTELAPAGVQARNPAFDITPAELITAIITEAGVLKPPSAPAIRQMVEAAR
jgi:methylthioribose-1-phosphate isomerase